MYISDFSSSILVYPRDWFLTNLSFCWNLPFTSKRTLISGKLITSFEHSRCALVEIDTSRNFIFNHHKRIKTTLTGLAPPYHTHFYHSTNWNAAESTTIKYLVIPRLCRKVWKRLLRIIEKSSILKERPLAPSRNLYHIWSTWMPIIPLSTNQRRYFWLKPAPQARKNSNVIWRASKFSWRFLTLKYFVENFLLPF